MFADYLVANGYTTPDIVKEINDFGLVIIAVAALLGLVLTISKIAVYFDRRRNDRFAKRVAELIDPKLDALYEFVDSRTTPIQPGENGGESLSDIHKRLDPIEAKLGLKERRHSGGTYLEMNEEPDIS